MSLLTCVMAWATDVNDAASFKAAWEDPSTTSIRLTNPITVSEVMVAAGDFTLDFNGQTITAGDYCLCVGGSYPNKLYNNVVTFTGEGGITADIGCLDVYSKVVINGGNFEANTKNGIYMNGAAELEMNGGSITTLESALVLSGTATITGGSITATTSNSKPQAISMQTNSHLEISGGSINAAACYGIMVRQGCELTFSDGEIVGNDGIGVVGGTLTVNDGSIITAHNGIGISNGTITVNNGSITGRNGIHITGGTLTVNNGSITGYNGIYMTGGTLTINDGTISSGDYLGSGIQQQGGTATINGGTINGILIGKTSVLNIHGGTIKGNETAIMGNGTAENGDTKINITGGNISGPHAGIYHPQAGSLTIKGNPVIKGHTAIQLCAGAGLTGSITGGRFEAFGTDNRASKTGDGVITDGAALSIVNRNYPGGTPMFAVNGGTFLAQHQDAILAYRWSNTNNTASTWAEATNSLSITEGIFSSDPSAYVPADDYTVEHLNPTPEVYNHDTVEYANLWRVGETTHEQSYDFTAAEAEYVKINGTTAAEASEKMEGTTYSLSENQSSKKVEVTENYKLVVKEEKTLNIGGGGLVLENNAQFVVEPGAVVTVGTNGIINANGADNIILETNADKQAVLLIDPDVIRNTKPLATVTIHTAARQKSASPYNYIWEYFACPVAEITALTKPTNNFNAGVHGLFEGESEFITGVYTWGGNDWALVNSWTSLVPFKGYQLTNNSANGGVEYTFKGNLLGNEDGEYAFTSNGYGYFGNSYSAPIVISNFLSALDNTVYERTVWLYDAGADTYVSVNPLAARLGSAKYKDGTAIKEIRSLQAFILNKKTDGANAQINYRDAIWNNPRINSLVSAAPAREQANDMQWTNIFVAANGNKEMVTLVESADFTNEFDNGADAGKYLNANSMNLYAVSNNGELSMVATDNLENTLLSFQAGNATEYTLSFENGNEDYMLRDNVTGQTIAMIEGAEYTFTQTANTTAQARFEVIAIAKMPTALENVEEAAKATGIYTITGQYMGRDFTKLPAGVYVVNGVKVVK